MATFNYFMEKNKILPGRTILNIAIITLCLSILLLALRPAPYIYIDPYTEDGYYSFIIARNIALGNGITITPGVWTNGFQPLITFIQAALFKISGNDSVLVLRLYFVFSFVVYIATAHFAACVSRHCTSLDDEFDLDHTNRSYIYCFTIFVGGSFLFFSAFNGLETGLVLFFYVISWWYYQIHYTNKIKCAFILGIILGFSVLARIDMSFFVAVLCTIEIWRSRRKEVVKAIIRAGIIALIALVVSSPWWLYNQFEFGSLMPISGRAQQSWISSWHEFSNRLGWWYSYSLNSLLPWTFLYQAEHVEFYELSWNFSNLNLREVAILYRIPINILGILVVLRFLKKAPNSARFSAWAIIITFVLLSAWYISSSFAIWFYGRYLIFIGIVGVIAVAHYISRWKFDILPILMLMPIAIYLIYPMWRDVPQALQNKDSAHHIYAAVRLIGEHVPAEEVVAAGQSGVIGYFCPLVVNMDGKVNPEVGMPNFDANKYLADHNVRWFADHKFYVSAILGTDFESKGWRVVDSLGPIDLLYREGPAPAETDESMASIRKAICF